MKRLLSGLVLTGICACAWAETPAALGDIPPPPSTHGYLRVSIPQWEFAADFAVRKQDGKKQGTYAPPLEDRSGSRSIGGWVLAGDYDVVGLNGKEGKRYAPITVRPGELTDLGVLLRIPLGGYESIIVPVRDADAALETEAALADLRSHLKTKDVIRWAPTELPAPVKDPQSSGMGLIIGTMIRKEKPPMNADLKSAQSIDELVERAKPTLRPRTEEPAVDGEGRLLYGADLGQIRVRNTDGNWGAIDTGKLTEITAIEVDDDRMVIGDLRGELRISKDRGLTWRTASRIGHERAFLDIDRVGKRWLVLAADFTETQLQGLADGVPGLPRGWRLGSKMYLYAATEDELGDLAVIREFELPHDGYGMIRPGSGFRHEVGAMDSFMGQAAGGFYFVNGVRNLHRLDLATMQWMALEPGHRVDFFRLSSDGKFLTARNVQGLATKISVSGDAGTTWRRIKRASLWTYDAVFQSDERADAVHWNGDMFKGRPQYYQYDAQKKAWRATGEEAPLNCVKMLRDGRDAPNYCLTVAGSIVARHDGAWNVEFLLD